MSLFITFEGIDGAGKSTHIEAFSHRLKARGRTVLRTREPGGSPLAEDIRELLLHQEMDALTEALLVFASRRDHIVRTIVPALRQGHTVVSDRFTDATFAYQGGGRGFHELVLEQLELWAQNLDLPWPGEGKVLEPDATFWFALPPQVAAERRAQARQADRFESQDLAFFERVHEGYAQRAKQHPHRFIRIDAEQDPEGVWQQIMAACESRGW